MIAIGNGRGWKIVAIYKSQCFVISCRREKRGENMSFVDVDEENFQNLINKNNCVYRVPAYQRCYSWNKEHWSDLFNDLKEIRNSDVHFMGTLVVISNKPETSTKINSFEIIDGQQRMATLFVLLIVLRDVLDDKNLSTDIQNQNLYIIKTGKDPEPKLVLSEDDNQQFRLLLDGKMGLADKSHNLIKCYEYFKEKFVAFKESERQEFLEKLLDRVNIVLINAQKLENAFKLFETLNDRGLELSAVDLLKNFVLKKAAAIQDNGVTFNAIKGYWAAMYGIVKDKEPVKYVRRYMLARYSGSISEKRLYEEIKNRISGFDNKGLSSFAKELSEYAEIYEDIYTSEYGDPEIDAKLADLNMIQVGPSYSLILRTLAAYGNSEITKDQVLRILHLIEVFNVRWGVCDQPTADLDGIYGPICLNFDNPVNHVDVEKQIEKYFKEKTKHIDAAFFEASFLGRGFKGSDTRTKYILWRLDDSSFGGAVTLNIENVNTEHIMPKNLSQKWQDYLASKTGKSAKDIEAEHGVWVNRLGNLTILEHRWNKAMKDSLYSDKRNGNGRYKGYKDSALRMTNEIANKYSEWTFSEIQQNAVEMSKKASKTWSF